MGAYLLANGLVVFLRRLRFISHAVPTQGVVVDVVSRQDQSDLMQYHYVPVISFCGPRGELRTFEAEEIGEAKVDLGQRMPPQVGQTVTAFRDPQDPADVRVGSGVGLWRRPLARAMTGAIRLVLGGVLVVRLGGCRVLLNGLPHAS